MTKAITEVLGIKYPIIQGGMAWISDAKLAAAVLMLVVQGLFLVVAELQNTFVKKSIRQNN